MKASGALESFERALQKRSALEPFEQALQKRRSEGLLRSLKPPPPEGSIDFTSNDYLDFSSHPLIRQRLIEGLSGGAPLSSGGSRLLGGGSLIYERLEARLADFSGREAALAFPSGFQANTGALQALARGRSVFSDQLCHASLIDGIRLSQSPRFIYPHNDLSALESLLKKASGDKLIVTESLFSMTGDFAPLREMASLARRHQALLYVDEAHATGFFGKNFSGAGSDLQGKERLVQLCSFSKALGSSGAFIACPKEIKDFLINFARSFIYTKGLSPLLALQWEAALEALSLEPERALNLRKKSLWIRRRLGRLGGSPDGGSQGAAALRRNELSHGLGLEETESPIVPVVFRSSGQALAAARALCRKGFFCAAAVPPSVPHDQPLLRLIIRHGHSREDLLGLEAALSSLLRRSESPRRGGQ